MPHKTTSEDGYRLGQWVSDRRKDHAKGRLATDRVAKFEALPGWTWDARQPTDPDQR